MIVYFHMKSGTTITQKHVKNITTRTDQEGHGEPGRFTSYEMTYDGLPDKAPKAHTIILSEIEAISTSER